MIYIDQQVTSKTCVSGYC